MKNKQQKIYMICITILLVIIISSLILFLLFRIEDKKDKVSNSTQAVENIKSHYNQYVVTNKETKIYELNNNNYKEVGFISKEVDLELLDVNIDENTKYFQIKSKELNYYIYYEDVEVINNFIAVSNRYKNYIVFNNSIITNDITNFYDENNNLVYKLNRSYTLPIIIMDDDKYGVEFNDKLMYIKDEDVKEVIDSNNTDLSNSSGIPVLNYHFVYEDGDEGCKEEICHSSTQIKQHFEYISNNDYFTPTMKELEMYIDGEIQLPQKSVVITFDDGARAEVAKKYVDMYKINATLFLVTSWFDKENFESEYMEVHSHGHDLHNTGICPGGQGGAIKCLDKEKLLIDLRTSSEKLDGTTVFCYPFYEYNSYSIEVLKEAGFTMAFAGEYAGGSTRVTVGADKFRLPRWVIVDYTTFDLFKEYIS